MQAATNDTRIHVGFTTHLDLASEKVGGRVLWATDDFFAEKENLLKPAPAVFLPDKYTDKGKWMDGWESRRKRVPGYDSAIIRLGIPGVVRGVNIDTAHFLGNFPEYASVDAIATEEGDPPFDQSASGWTEIVPRQKLHGGTQNMFAVHSDRRWTHLRLNIFPDGGVARFRVHGQVVPDVARLKASGELVDLAAVANGGVVIQANDAFFGPKDNLILPGRAAHMGEGWETRRKRVPGFDWIVVKLAAPGMIQKVEVDTNHFKGNYPESCSLDGVRLETEVLDFANAKELPWKELLPRVKLGPSQQHYFEKELVEKGPFTHVRLNIFPDGGVSRLRLYGRPV
ncbi:MAG: allantoicase [Myxococcaceae bacterium]|nr:allantoicase [Myxococcaceae bacterium]